MFMSDQTPSFDNQSQNVAATTTSPEPKSDLDQQSSSQSSTPISEQDQSKNPRPVDQQHKSTVQSESGLVHTSASRMTRLKTAWQNISIKSLVLLLVFLLVSWWGGVLILLTLNQEYRVEQEIIQLESEIVAGEAQLAQQLQSVEQERQLLDQALPDESGLSQFVLAVNQALTGFPEGKLRFDAQAPLKQEDLNARYLPVIISGRGEIDQWLQFLDVLTRSQYLFLPEQFSLAWQETDESSQLVKVVIRGKLYVDQNF